MTTIDANPGGNGLPDTANLSTAQTGNGASTNIADRGGKLGPVLLKLTTTVGAVPTLTVAVEGSPDGVNWFSVPYVDVASPTTITVAALVITTAATSYKIIQPNIPARYLRLTYSLNTNVTTTADVWAFCQ